MHIIAYTYTADLHCIRCTVSRFKRGSFALNPKEDGRKDANGLPQNLQDYEANLIHPVFSTDEMSLNTCGDCHKEIEGIRVVFD